VVRDYCAEPHARGLRRRRRRRIGFGPLAVADTDANTNTYANTYTDTDANSDAHADSESVEHRAGRQRRRCERHIAD
jgi:hypothetical protein